jgi:hypothetical protein
VIESYASSSGSYQRSGYEPGPPHLDDSTDDDKACEVMPGVTAEVVQMQTRSERPLGEADLKR